MASPILPAAKKTATHGSKKNKKTKPEVVTITEEELDKFWEVVLQAKCILEITQSDPKDDSGHETVTRRAVHALLKPFETALVDLYCELSNRLVDGREARKEGAQ